MGSVVAARADTIGHERRAARLPRRNAFFPILTQGPRRTTELLLTGMRANYDPEVAR